MQESSLLIVRGSQHMASYQDHPDIIVTSQLNLLELVKKRCPGCPNLVVPPGADKEPDIWRCKVVAGRHCVTVVGTSRCVRAQGHSEDIER